MTKRQFSHLAAAYAGVKTVTPANFDKLKKAVAPLPVRDLRKMAKSGIPFIDTAANSVLVDAGVLPETARIDHAADVCIRRATRTKAI